jgi:hypothetical protein
MSGFVLFKEIIDFEVQTIILHGSTSQKINLNFILAALRT